MSNFPIELPKFKPGESGRTCIDDTYELKIEYLSEIDLSRPIKNNGGLGPVGARDITTHAM